MNIKMEIRKVKLSELKISEYNPRKISKDELQRLEDSMDKFGYVEPIVWNEKTGNIVGGHQRLKILSKKLTSEDTIEVVVVNLDEYQEKALNLALNKITGDWDEDKLSELLTLIKQQDEDLLKFTGFSEQEYNKLIGYLTQEDNFEIPKEPKYLISKGEIWQLGNHRLMCGDATIKEDIDKLMGGKEVDMVFTDPPYSVGYEKKTKEIFKDDSYTKITNDELNVKEISEKIWRPSFKNMYDISKEDCSFYMTMPQGGDQMMMMMMSENWKVKHEFIWVKPQAVFSMNRLDYDYQHEPIIFGWKNKHNFYGLGEFTKSIWNIGRDKEKLHPTMKPIELIINAINNSSLQYQIILDVFGGSGSTLIACEQTKRVCYMMELDPFYCSVIIERFINLKGQDNVWRINQDGTKTTIKDIQINRK